MEDRFSLLPRSHVSCLFASGLRFPDGHYICWKSLLHEVASLPIARSVLMFDLLLKFNLCTFRHNEMALQYPDNSLAACTVDLHLATFSCPKANSAADGVAFIRYVIVSDFTKQEKGKVQMTAQIT